MKITVLGDIMCEPPLLKASKRKDGTYDFDGVFKSVRSVVRGSDPYLLDVEAETVKRLTRIANEVTGEEGLPYTLGGRTYAHRLPNALVYGMSGCLRPEGFPKDRGGAHGIDEVEYVL